MYTYTPAWERRAHTLYRVYLHLTHEERQQIATAILIGSPRNAALIYGVVQVKAVIRYHVALKNRWNKP